MKRRVVVYSAIALCLIAVAIVLLRNRDNGNYDVLICTVQASEHPNLDNVYLGFKEEIDKWAEENGRSVKYELQNARGEVKEDISIVNGFVPKKPDIILALGTQAAEAAQDATSEIPIVFGAITDPVGSGLVKTMDKPGDNLTGSCDKWPYEKQFELIKLLYPYASSVGVVFNPSESNTETSMREIRRITSEMGLSLNEASVSNSTDVYSAAQSLIRKSDIFYAPADNTVLPALDAYLKVAKQYHIPLFVGDQGSVEKGGVATYGPDYYELGIETGKIGVRILNGENPSDISVAVATSGELVINKSSSEFFQVTYPDSLLKIAKFFE